MSRGHTHSRALCAPEIWSSMPHSSAPRRILNAPQSPQYCSVGGKRHGSDKHANLTLTSLPAFPAGTPGSTSS